jgi:hypothetical protein
MVLEARFKRGLSTQNRISPLIPLKGDVTTQHCCEYG